MKRIQLYTTGSFFLMTLSAAAETWFAGVSSNQSLFLPSYDLLKILMPTAINRFELVGLEYFPMFWGLLTSTVLQLPLWSIFAVTSVGYSYLLLSDPTEIKRYGKNFENLEMWAKSSVQDDAINNKISNIKAISSERKSFKSAHMDPEIWCPVSSKEDEINEADEEVEVIEYKISEFVTPASDSAFEGNGDFNRHALNTSIKYAHADPEIWVPIFPSKEDNTDIDDDNLKYKDEIYEFDELCEFLNYTEMKLDDELILEPPKNK